MKITSSFQLTTSFLGGFFLANSNARKSLIRFWFEIRRAEISSIGWFISEVTLAAKCIRSWSVSIWNQRLYSQVRIHFQSELVFSLLLGLYMTAFPWKRKSCTLNNVRRIIKRLVLISFCLISPILILIHLIDSRNIWWNSEEFSWFGISSRLSILSGSSTTGPNPFDNKQCCWNSTWTS